MYRVVKTTPIHIHNEIKHYLDIILSVFGSLQEPSITLKKLHV